MILPTTKTPALRKDPRLLVIYGPPKVGKTEMLSKLEGCLVVDTEKGTEHIEAMKLQLHSLAELDQLANLIKIQKKDYKYVAVDTIDEVESWCEWHARELYTKTPQGRGFQGNSILDLEYGAGQRWLRTAFNKYLKVITEMAPNVIVVCHVRDKYLAGAKAFDGSQLTGDVEAKDIDLTGKCRNILCSAADAIGYVSRGKDDKLMINFKSNDGVNCGGRCEHLKGQKFEFDWSRIYIDGVKEEIKTV